MSHPDQTTASVDMVEMVVHRGPAAGERFLLRQRSFTVGRGTEANVQLHDEVDPNILSRCHVRIQIENDAVHLEDASTNGTWIGRTRLSRGDRVEISPTSEVWLGPRIMFTVQLLNLPEFDCPEAATAPTPAARESAPDNAPGIPISIKALGQLEVSIGGNPFPNSQFPNRKVAVLLTYLVELGGRSVSANLMNETLWPDALEGTRTALQTCVSRLRKTFQDFDAKLPDPVELRLGSYRLSSMYTTDYDVARFQALCEAAARKTEGTFGGADGVDPHHEEAERARILERAINMVRGPFLDGHNDEWTIARRRSLDSHLFEAIDTLARLREQQGQIDEAIRLYAAVLEREPCREYSQIGLLRTLARAQRHEEVTRQFNNFTRVLKKTLDVPPGEELVRVFEAAQQRKSAAP